MERGEWQKSQGEPMIDSKAKPGAEERGREGERLLSVVCELFAVGNVCLSCSRKRTSVILARSVHKPRGACCVTDSGRSCTHFILPLTVIGKTRGCVWQPTGPRADSFSPHFCWGASIIHRSEDPFQFQFSSPRELWPSLPGPEAVLSSAEMAFPTALCPPGVSAVTIPFSAIILLSIWQWPLS